MYPLQQLAATPPSKLLGPDMNESGSLKSGDLDGRRNPSTLKFYPDQTVLPDHECELTNMPHSRRQRSTTW